MKNFYARVVKRMGDIIFALIALVVFLPVMIGVCVMLWLTGHRSLFFVQQRVGYQNRIFKLIKFKSMTDAKDESGALLPDAVRLTKFGLFLRKSSLDELPQLLNVLKGDMSLIGPRPLLVSYLPLYNDRQKRRHEVTPGITGWAQVNGRNAISWTEKFELDVWYVINQSFSLDVKIFFLTIKNVLKSEGISQDGQATMEAFKG